MTANHAAPRRILIIEGHPDPSRERLCHALAESYREGARNAGHELRTLILGDLDIPLLGGRSDWEAPASSAIHHWQDDLLWADHVVLVFPLWLGDMPALVKAFLEQVLRPGFAFNPARMVSGGLLTGRSVRVVVTMGMPGWLYVTWFGAHSLRSLKRNILRFVGFGPVRATLFGMVEGASAARRRGWIDKMNRLGRLGR